MIFMQRKTIKQAKILRMRGIIKSNEFACSMRRLKEELRDEG